ncbi:MAG: exodeoxyribonuclease V subunit gamma, partial [Cocleimonas sp.]
MLTLHTSNQLELLSEQFAQSIESPLKSVFTPELVVVQNSGMARYLSLQVADKNNISANTDFLFPAEFMWQMLKSVLPNISDQDPSSPFVIRWRLLDLLISEIEAKDKEFPELAHYLGSTDLAWELSQKLAELLDKILFYRDDWVRDWENSTSGAGAKNPEDLWQARLWKKVFTDNQLDHWLSLQDQFIEAIQKPQNRKFLPDRVSFFSLSALSPGYIRLLGEMGKVIDINIFIINPCPKEYWGDIESEKSISKKPADEQPYYDLGNALLASMGRQGRDFIDQLQDLSNNDPKEFFIEQVATTLLSQIQNDVLALNTAKKITLFNDDDGSLLVDDSKRVDDSLLVDGSKQVNDSIQFHACHTAMREVEVLHDQLLDCLENDADLTPSDIIVMMPDIEKYAPFIDAVFSSKSDSTPKLPFRIADKNSAQAHPTIEAFLKTLDLINKRFDAESVFELLDYDSIREQFNLTEDEVIFCREIARATNIRWGINAESRKQSNLPDTEEHTWRYALERLLLGYALPGDDLFIPQQGTSSESALSGLPLLPYSEIEGSQAVVISQLIQFTDRVFKLETLASQVLSMDDWLEQFNQFITSLFADGSQNKVLFNALDKLRQQSLLADFGTYKEKGNDNQGSLKLPFSVVAKIIKQSLQEITGNENFMGYGITFCALVPMRSVPFKVVALLGMNDGEYPRQDRILSFDMVAKKPRKGDRSRRNEDRYLFLESILAARKQLIISYIGQSVKDNTALPPSVLVSELLDEVCIYTDTKAHDWICNHPLQAFSPRYFDASDKRLFS